MTDTKTESLAEKLQNWRTHEIGQMYATCKAPPPAVTHVILHEHVASLESDNAQLREQLAEARRERDQANVHLNHLYAELSCDTGEDRFARALRKIRSLYKRLAEYIHPTRPAEQGACAAKPQICRQCGDRDRVPEADGNLSYPCPECTPAPTPPAGQGTDGEPLVIGGPDAMDRAIARMKEAEVTFRRKVLLEAAEHFEGERTRLLDMASEKAGQRDTYATRVQSDRAYGAMYARDALRKLADHPTSTKGGE